MKWKVVLVPYPFDDLSGFKVRPALCLTDEIGSYKHLIIAFITSSIPKPAEFSDLEVLPSHPNFSKTGLKVPSAVRLHRMVTMPSSLVQRNLGEFSPVYQQAVEQKIRHLFGL